MFVQFINMKDRNPQPNPLLLSSWNRLFYYNLLIASASSPRLSSDDENLICSLLFRLFLTLWLSQKKVEPWKLYTMVSCLLIVDFVILITWQIQDPLERTLESFPLEDPISVSDDIKIRPELEHCESENNSIWLGKWNHRFPPCAASCRRLCSLLLTSSLFLWCSPSAVVGAIRKSVYNIFFLLSWALAVLSVFRQNLSFPRI